MDKPCTHIFAECPDECTSFNYRATVITDKARREINRGNIVRFVAATVAFMAFFLGILVAVATIYPQAARNWQAVVTANQEQ